MDLDERPPPARKPRRLASPRTSWFGKYWSCGTLRERMTVLLTGDDRRRPEQGVSRTSPTWRHRAELRGDAQSANVPRGP
jgi:hypothetical protein